MIPKNRFGIINSAVLLRIVVYTKKTNLLSGWNRNRSAFQREVRCAAGARPGMANPRPVRFIKHLQKKKKCILSK
jgi:hypothetical protein